MISKNKEPASFSETVFLQKGFLLKRGGDLGIGMRIYYLLDSVTMKAANRFTVFHLYDCSTCNGLSWHMIMKIFFRYEERDSG